MIYTTGTIAINGNTVTGTGTNFSAPLSLIRVGCTLIAIGNPVQIFTITEIKNGTELSVTPAANPAIPAGTKFSILLSDSISVDGLAQDVAETLRFYQEKEDEISSAIDGSNIGLGQEPRDCADISGDPSSYVGFLRIKETAKGFPSVAAGESFLSGFICQRDTTPSYTGVFVGWATRSLYTYTWIATSGPQWTRHARKDEVDRLLQNGGSSKETQLRDGENKNYIFVNNTGWGAYSNSGAIKLGVMYGGTGGGNAEEARKNLMVMHDAKTTLSDSQNLDDLKGSAAGFYHQVLSANAKPELNYPIQIAGSLLVQKTGAGDTEGCIQTYYLFNNMAISYRRAYGGQGWSAWKKIAATERVDEWGSETWIYNADNSMRLGLSASTWGCYSDTQKKWIPLAVSQGGTGALTASDARNNLNLGESNAVKFKNLTLTEALDANLGVLVKTGRDWNTQHTDNIQKFIPIAGSTNGPAGAMVLGGFHAQYSANHAVQFGGRNSGFWGRTIENGTVQEWRQLATLNTSGQKWTAGQHFVTTKINSYDFTRHLTIDVIENAKTNARLRLWGSETRQSVLEYGLSNAETDEYNTYGFYCQLNPDGVISFQVNGVVNCTAVNQTSDRDLKDNIQVIGDATEAIRKMNGYTYTLKENGLPYAGVIAQEVIEALPEAVGSFTHYGKALQGPTIDGNELREETRYLNVDYAAVTGLLVQVARETDNRVTELEEENASLRANIAAMDERIAKLESLVRQLTGSEE